jgi:hypothetical protein
MKLKGIVLVLAALLAINCASLPTKEKMQAEVASYELPAKADKAKALIYVVRPSSAGALIAFNVFLDNTESTSEMGYNRGSGYIYFYAKPGMHNIFSKAENTAELELNTVAGGVYFIRQDVEMGLIMARNSLVVIDELEGKYHMKNTSVGTIIRKE